MYPPHSTTSFGSDAAEVLVRGPRTQGIRQQSWFCSALWGLQSQRARHARRPEGIGGSWALAHLCVWAPLSDLPLSLGAQRLRVRWMPLSGQTPTPATARNPGMATARARAPTLSMKRLGRRRGLPRSRLRETATLRAPTTTLVTRRTSPTQHATQLAHALTNVLATSALSYTSIILAITIASPANCISRRFASLPPAVALAPVCVAYAGLLVLRCSLSFRV